MFTAGAKKREMRTNLSLCHNLHKTHCTCLDAWACAKWVVSTLFVGCFSQETFSQQLDLSPDTQTLSKSSIKQLTENSDGHLSLPLSKSFKYEKYSLHCSTDISFSVESRALQVSHWILGRSL